MFGKRIQKTKMDSQNQLGNQNHAIRTPVSIQMMGVYGGITAVILISLLILSNSLQQYPRFMPNSENQLQPRWRVVTDGAQRVTFNMPERWSWVEKGAEPFELIVANEVAVETAVSTFLRIDPDTNITLLAFSNEAAIEEGIIVVAQSERMKQLAATQLVQFMAENNVPGIQKAELITQNGNPQQVSLITEMQIETDVWLCYQKYTHNERAGYIISGCAVRSKLGMNGEELKQAVATFQPLLQAPISRP